MRNGFVGLLLAGLVLAGCGERLGVTQTRLSVDEFVNATVALRRAAVETANPAAFQVRKREIEAKLHFSDADLRDFTRAHEDDAPLISAAWDSVEARLDRPATAPPGSRDAPVHPGPPGRPGLKGVRGSSDYRLPDGTFVQVEPGALPGGGDAIVETRPLTPPSDDTLPPAPPPRVPPKVPPEHKSFY